MGLGNHGNRDSKCSVGRRDEDDLGRPGGNLPRVGSGPLNVMDEARTGVTGEIEWASRLPRQRSVVVVSNANSFSHVALMGFVTG